MKFVLLLVVFLVCLAGTYLTSSADKDDYSYIYGYAKDSPEATEKVKAFLSENPTVSRYDIIKLRSEVKPLVDTAARKSITQ